MLSDLRDIASAINESRHLAEEIFFGSLMRGPSFKGLYRPLLDAIHAFTNNQVAQQQLAELQIKVLKDVDQDLGSGGSC